MTLISSPCCYHNIVDRLFMNLFVYVDVSITRVIQGFEFWLGEESGYFSKGGRSPSKAKMTKMKERSDRWSPYRSLASMLLLAVGQGVEGRGPLDCLKGL